MDKVVLLRYFMMFLVMGLIAVAASVVSEMTYKKRSPRDVLQLKSV